MLTKIFRIIIGIGLAYGLIHFTLKYTGGNIWKEIQLAQKPILLLALLMYGGASISLPIYRWNLLLKVQKINIRVCELIRLTMIGGFFNLALPGAVSGDLVKMIYLAKQTKGKRTEAILTVILDRSLGLIGLFIIASIMILLYLPFLLDLDQQYRSIQVASLTVGFVCICGILSLPLIKFRDIIIKIFRMEKIVKYMQEKLPKSIVSALTRLINAFDLYRNNFRSITIGIALSILIHSCLAVILFMVGLSIREDVLRFGDYFLSTQVSSAIAIIPITPGGIGIRDATIAFIFSALHVNPEKIGTLPVIMTLIIVFWRLVGGMVFIFYRFPKPDVRSTLSVNHESMSLRSFDVE